jgi:predicted transcriptional regulator
MRPPPAIPEQTASFAFGDARLALADRTPISNVMERNVVSVPPDLDLPALSALLLAQGISGAPVVDPEGRPLGVVSKTDLVRALNAGPHPDPRLTVRDVMMPLSFSLTESSSIARAAALMTFEGVHRILIVNMSGAIVGVLSALDILRWVARKTGYVVPG